MRKFANFQDQLKQIRMSEDYLKQNPDVARQVHINEVKAKAAASNQVFQIGDDEDDDDNENQLIDPSQAKAPKG